MISNVIVSCRVDCLPEDKLHNLGICDEALPIRSPPEGTKEVVEVHQHMDECVGQERNLLQRLCICQPKIRHWDDSGMMENVQKAERLFLHSRMYKW